MEDSKRQKIIKFLLYEISKTQLLNKQIKSNESFQISIEVSGIFIISQKNSITLYYFFFVRENTFSSRQTYYVTENIL